VNSGGPIRHSPAHRPEHTTNFNPLSKTMDAGTLAANFRKQSRFVAHATRNVDD
jgi:hypothetical protein